MGPGGRMFKSCHPDTHAQLRASHDCFKTCTKICGCSSMVELQPSKLIAWVRFPSPAPYIQHNAERRFFVWSGSVGENLRSVGTTVRAGYCEGTRSGRASTSTSMAGRRHSFKFQMSSTGCYARLQGISLRFYLIASITALFAPLALLNGG